MSEVEKLQQQLETLKVSTRQNQDDLRQKLQQLKADAETRIAQLEATKGSGGTIDESLLEKLKQSLNAYHNILMCLTPSVPAGAGSSLESAQPIPVGAFGRRRQHRRHK